MGNDDEVRAGHGPRFRAQPEAPPNPLAGQQPTEEAEAALKEIELAGWQGDLRRLLEVGGIAAQGRRILGPGAVGQHPEGGDRQDQSVA